MPNRIEWIEIVLVGLIGGLAVGCIGFALRLGASTDNLLNFFGSALGSGLAVVAALWLESHRRNKALERLSISLVLVASVAMRFKYENEEIISSLILTYKQSADAFEVTRLSTTVESPLHQYSLQTCISWMKRTITKIEELEVLLESQTITEEDFIASVRACGTYCVGPVSDFLALEGIPRSAKKTFDQHENFTEQRMQVGEDSGS